MNWEALSGFADLLASMGVIVSLVYVAIQLKLNSKTVSTSNYQQNMAFIASTNLAISENTELSNIYLRGLRSYSGLKDEEKVRFQMIMTNYIIPQQMNIQLYSRGLMDKDHFLGQVDSSMHMFSAPGVLEWWQENRQWFHKDFVSYVDDLVVEKRT